MHYYKVFLDCFLLVCSIFCVTYAVYYKKAKHENSYSKCDINVYK